MTRCGSSSPAKGREPQLDEKPTTAIIIPAYNEENTLGNVLRALADSGWKEIIVVSDGSTDRTARVARQHGAQVVELPVNLGKGGAMKIGSLSTQAEYLLFLDADLVGITKEHVDSLFNPVLRGEADMTVGIFDEGRLSTDLAQRIAPFLSGQRAMHRSVLEQIPDLEKTRYGVEVVLSRFAEANGLRVKAVILKDCSHVMKEEKQGLWKGFTSRMKMYWEILKSLA
ncbi:MAG: glycosyltransferase family 2 protein [Firmicutes bacterium]|jgi:glycosyltransferase involved in cell wall biosynthesis|nr:glycosyltransferase family 2 protein [Bacillota bacterium]